MFTKYLNIKHDYEGINCLSLICKFYEKELNIPWEEEKLLFNNLHFTSIREIRKIPVEKLHNLKNWIKIDLLNIRKYDIIVYTKNEKLSHFAMYVGEQKILDLREEQHSVLRHFNDRQRDHIEGCYRHKQLAA